MTKPHMSREARPRPSADPDAAGRCVRTIPLGSDGEVRMGGRESVRVVRRGNRPRRSSSDRGRTGISVPALAGLALPARADSGTIASGDMSSEDADFALGPGEPSSSMRAVPLQLGGATVFIEQIGEGPAVEGSDAIYPVAPDPRQAMEHALGFVHGCVTGVGERVAQIAGSARPQEVTLEFTLAFDAKSRTALIPVLVTGQAGVQTGLKVTAVWRQDAADGH